MKSMGGYNFVGDIWDNGYVITVSRSLDTVKEVQMQAFFLI